MSSEHTQGLKPATLFFYLAALLLFVVAVASVSQFRTRKVREKTLIEMTKAQEGLTKIKASIANRKQALATFRSQLDQNSRAASPEMILYKKFDELKAGLAPADVTMGGIEKKGGEASLPFAATFTNPDFNVLLNTVSALHSSTFPMTPVSAISVAQADSKSSGGIIYRITGRIITDDKAKP